MKTKRLYYVRCIATHQGPKLEREVKDYARQFDEVVCDTDGWWNIVRALNDMTWELRKSHPSSKLINVTYEKIGGKIFLLPEHQSDNGDLLKVIPIKQYYLKQDVKTFLKDGNEYAEEV